MPDHPLASIGWWRNARARPPRPICWDSARSSTQYRFFWSQHDDVPINDVGHAEKSDEIAIEGDIAGRNCLLKYKGRGRVLAVASIYRDLQAFRPSLRWSRLRADRPAGRLRGFNRASKWVFTGTVSYQSHLGSTGSAEASMRVDPLARRTIAELVSALALGTVMNLHPWR